MKIQKNWLLGGAAALLLGLTSCQDGGNKVEPKTTDGATTFMSVAIDLNLPQEELLKAGEENIEHNPAGHWEGRDKIVGVDIYILDPSTGTVETKGLNVITAPASGATGAAGNDGVYATAAWKVTPGNGKKLYAVVNNGGAIKTALDAAAATGATDFEAAYKTAYAYNFSDYAKEEGTGATKKDIILMSSEAKTIDIKPNITQTQATIQTGTVNANNNQFDLSVRRSVARVAVTCDGANLPAKKGQVKDATGTTALGNIEVKGWYYGQYEKTTPVLWDASATDKSTTAKTYLNRTTKSPKFDFVVTSTTPKTEREANYDYSTLANAKKVEVNSLTLTGANATVDQIVEHGNMQFLTETTHQYGTKDQTGYRKGNTPYVLIETEFTPSTSSWAAGQGTGYTAGTTIYYSTYNGKFYTNEAAAKAASTANAKAAENKDGVVKFTNGKMYYFAWLNPDTLDPTTWFNSPVLRNNIYHIHVTGFKKLGFSGDPFNPTTSNDKPVDPDDVVPSPDEKLNIEETWMSAKITVVNWGVHSYNISF